MPPKPQKDKYTDSGRVGKLLILLQDANRQPIVRRSKVIVLGAPGGLRLSAVGKDKEVTRFTFELPAGDYSVQASAAGYENATLLVSMGEGHQREESVVLKFQDRGKAGDGESGGEKPLVDGRFRTFVELRSGSKEDFPSDARERALEDKRRMLDADVINRLHLNVKSIDRPGRISSFGDIDAWVEVTPRYDNQPFRRALLKIPYSREKLGWADPATLRVFEFAPKEGKYRLIPESGVDIPRDAAYAYIKSPGVYCVIGLPLAATVLKTVNIFGQMQAKGDGQRIPQNRICELILCPDDARLEAITKLPGGVQGSACEFCKTLDLLPDGLPENQIFGGPPPGPPPSGMCSWLSIGPRNINGRIRAIAIHPNDGSRVFAGTANAGVWGTTDAGVSWKPLMFQEAALEIGALALHLTDPAIPAGDVTIYAGTGEPTSWPGYKGVGVLKSTASGATWATTGSIPSPGGDRFAAIAIDSTSVTADPSATVVYAGGPGGLYKSINGGGTWTQVLNKNIQSIALDPVNPQIIYVGAAFEGVFKFDPVTSTWSAFNSGFAGGFPQLIAVGIGNSAPHKLYAKLDQAVYVFNTVTNTWQSLGNHGGTTYGYWNNFLAVDPQDSNIVVVGGFAVERTYDGGTTWQSPSAGHEDQHAAVFDTSNHLNVYVGNDGGVFRGTYASVPDTGTWTKRSNGMTISALNTIGTAPAEGADFMGSGVQDNGTIRTTGGLTWNSLPIGGDGSAFIFDPGNALITYGQLTTVGVNGHPYKSTNGGASFSPADAGFPDGTFLGVMALDANSLPEPNRVLYVSGSSAVYRTTNSAGSWGQSSPALGGAPSAIMVSPTSSAIVYAGSTSGAIWRSSDGGATMANWKNIRTGNLPGTATLPSRAVSSIVVHPTDPNTVFIAFSGFNGASPGHVFKATSSDGYVTWRWQEITSNLPDTPVNAIEINRGALDTLWVGTDTGVYQTTDGGLSWAPFDNGFPNVVVTALALNAGGDRLRAATNGYSMWEIPLGTACDQEDLYIRDNKLDTGEATALSDIPDPTSVGDLLYWWESVDIKVDAFPYYTPPIDGVEFDQAVHENPVRNDAAHPNPNRLYVQVHNRGPETTHNTKVKMLWADASAGLPPLPSDFWATYPNAWGVASVWAPVDPAVPFQNIPELLPHTPKIVTWNWVIPITAATHSCVLAVISSDEDAVNRSDANPNDHFVWVVAPTDKHIALKNMSVVTAAPPPPGGSPIQIDFHNPMGAAGFFDIEFDPGTLPRSSKVSLMMPAVLSRDGFKGKGQHVPIRPSRNKEWKWEFRLSDGVGKDPCTGVASATVSGILIPEGKYVRAAVTITVPRGKPGGVYHCAILQRAAGVLLGGNTYEMRVPPTEVVVRWQKG